MKPIFTGHNTIKIEINNQKKTRKTYENQETLAERIMESRKYLELRNIEKLITKTYGYN